MLMKMNTSYSDGTAQDLVHLVREQFGLELFVVQEDDAELTVLATVKL